LFPKHQTLRFLSKAKEVDVISLRNFGKTSVSLGNAFFNLLPAAGRVPLNASSLQVALTPHVLLFVEHLTIYSLALAPFMDV
jgi:hypothetical protein